MPNLLELFIPDIGDADEVEVIEISIAVGDEVGLGDVLLTVESDKAAMDIPCEQAGRITELLLTVGDKVKKEQLFARLEGVSNSATDAVAIGDDQALVKPALPADLPESDVPVKVEAVTAVYREPRCESEGKQHWAPAGPASRRLARELGLDISQVTGSGRRGRIFVEDVKAYANSLLKSAASSANKTPPAEISELPDLCKYGPTHAKELSKLEIVTSRNMQRAWREIPHAWLQQRVDITELDQGRRRLKAENPDVTLTALVIKATALGLKAFPRFNSVLDVQSQQLLYRDYVHVGVAVDTPRGLVIAVIREADKLTITGIGAELSRLSALARLGALQLSDMQGAGMTVSSLGGLGIDGLQPIVNWPEVAILGVAMASMQPVYSGDQFEPRLLLPITLGFDHRVINGADGARFLCYLQSLLSDPMRLLVNS